MSNITQETKNFKPEEHLIQLKGKDYLQVMWRLVWFRAERPNWCIDTEAHHISEKVAIFHARIYDENGVLKASGYGSETPKDFGDYIEKAETKSIGRALAMMGYGTQFTADELDEGERIVDSAVKKNIPPADPVKTEPADPVKTEPEELFFRCEDCGAIIKGGKYQGKELGARAWTNMTKKLAKKQLCPSCMRKANV